MTFILGCSNFRVVTIEQFSSYIQESSSRSIHRWYLEKEDQSFYYIKRKTGVVKFDLFKVSKQDVTLDVSGELPSLIKFSDIRQN